MMCVCLGATIGTHGVCVLGSCVQVAMVHRLDDIVLLDSGGSWTIRIAVGT